MDTSKEVVCQMSHHDIYVVEVCLSNALIPVNAWLTAFALQDYDPFLRQFKVTFGHKQYYQYVCIALPISMYCSVVIL